MAGIHAEEVNWLKAGLFRSYQRQIYGWKMSIGENAASLPPDWNKTALSFLLNPDLSPNRILEIHLDDYRVNQDLEMRSTR